MSPLHPPPDRVLCPKCGKNVKGCDWHWGLAGGLVGTTRRHECTGGNLGRHTVKPDDDAATPAPGALPGETT